jgi:hypothetical protein
MKAADNPTRVRCSAEGLTLDVAAVQHGRLAPAVRLQVFAQGTATSIGATIPATEGEKLAAAILAAARHASEVQLFAPPASVEP